MKAVHSINTTVSTLHGITPLEVVIGRPVNEKSVMLAMRNSANKLLPIPQDLTLQNEEDKENRNKQSKAIHAVIVNGQNRQIRSHRRR